MYDGEGRNTRGSRLAYLRQLEADSQVPGHIVYTADLVSATNKAYVEKMEEDLQVPGHFIGTANLASAANLKAQMEHPQDFAVRPGIGESGRLVRISDIPEWELAHCIRDEVLRERAVDATYLGCLRLVDRVEVLDEIKAEANRRVAAELDRRKG